MSVQRLKVCSVDGFSVRWSYLKILACTLILILKVYIQYMYNYDFGPYFPIVSMQMLCLSHDWHSGTDFSLTTLQILTTFLMN